MTKVFRYLATAAMAAVLSACVELRSAEEAKAPSPPALAASGGPTVVRTGDWNEFRVDVPASIAERSLRKSVITADRKTFGAPSWAAVVPGRTFVDADVVPGEVYLYEWGRLKSGVFEAEGRARLAIPLDIEVTKDVVGGEEARRLFTTEVFGRLIFREVTVETEGRTWVPRAESMTFERTVLRTFAAGARAADGFSGRGGGRVHLIAPLIVGELKIEMRGEDGGDGRPARVPDATLKGFAGRPGRGPVAEDLGSCDTFGCRILKCVTQATDGEPGYPGRRGYDGETGGDGGSSGEILIEAGDRRDFRFTAEFLPGRAGRGGPGGAGGEGGDGGPGGTYPRGPTDSIQFKDCGPVRAGQRGPEGPRGSDGRPGESGQRQKLCLVDAGSISCH